MNKIIMIGVSIALSACISQKVTEVGDIGSEEICIIKNTAVRSDFVDAYIRALKERMYAVSLKDTVIEAQNCVVTSTYTASYRFHWGEYLSTAELKVFKRGKLVGEVLYRAPYANPAKHGRIAPKIAAMVNDLFPAQ